MPTATVDTAIYSVGNEVKINRVTDPTDNRYCGLVGKVESLTPKGWLRVVVESDRVDKKNVTLHPNWVERLPGTTISSELQDQDEGETGTADELEDQDEDQELKEETEIGDELEDQDENEELEEETGTADELEDQDEDQELEDETGTGEPESEQVAAKATNQPSSAFFDFTVSCKEFTKALAGAMRAVGSLSIHPILSCVKVDILANKQIKFTGFDLSFGSIVFCTAITVKQPGSYAFPASLLYNLLTLLPDGEIRFQREESATNGTVTITAGNGTYNINGHDAYEYPDLPDPINDSKTPVPIAGITQKALRIGLDSTAYAASTDPTKQVLCGVHFSITSDMELEMAATDGHRLAKFNTSLSSLSLQDTVYEFTLPSKTCSELRRLLVSDDDVVKISFDSGIIKFEVGAYTIISRLIEGLYPAYNSLIPRAFALEVWAEKLQLISALKRVQLLSESKHQCVKMTISNEEQTINIQASNPEVGSGNESLSAQISGQDIILAFNVKYLIHALEVQTTEEVAIRINQPATPVIINPLNGYNVLALVMPVQLKS
ncbi:MAG TPA: DNA polymerase III subunit beta [Nostocaceae cyanobacterium]|nr:DNA polymerase III subunit beta [Nostocaceae cyanobacterium]